MYAIRSGWLEVMPLARGGVSSSDVGGGCECSPSGMWWVWMRPLLSTRVSRDASVGGIAQGEGKDSRSRLKSQCRLRRLNQMMPRMTVQQKGSWLSGAGPNGGMHTYRLAGRP